MSHGEASAPRSRQMTWSSEAVAHVGVEVSVAFPETRMEEASEALPQVVAAAVVMRLSPSSSRALLVIDERPRPSSDLSKIQEAATLMMLSGPSSAALAVIDAKLSQQDGVALVAVKLYQTPSRPARE